MMTASTTVKEAESIYVRRKKQLKEDLIQLNRSKYTSIPLSPLMEEEDTPLLDFCLEPDIYSVELQRALGGKVKRTCADSLLDVFYKGGKTCFDIYLTADAGLGKTVFSNRLAFIWCQAHASVHNDIKRFCKEEIQAMEEFEYLFLVFLRDSSGACDIDDFIIKLIIRRLAHSSLSLEDLEKISTEKCLIILDGLDEWSNQLFPCKHGPSEIPHRKARECTILTTSRPWKLGAIRLKSSEIDRRIELVGHKKEEEKALKLKAISQLCDEKDERNLEILEKDFTEVVHDKRLTDLETILLFFMYLLCLWCENIDLGSRSE